MSFGTDKKEPVEDRKITKVITIETIIALVVISAVFGAFAWKMGLANMFGRRLEIAMRTSGLSPTTNICPPLGVIT